MDQLIWQQKKDVAGLRVSYLTNGLPTWRLIPWHGQELHTYLVWVVING